MSPDDVRRFARHILLPDVGGIGQAALLASRADVDVREPAGAIAAAFLAAAGVRVREVTTAGDVALPAAPAWWPAAPDDATALAWYRGSTAATRWLAGTIASARSAP